MRPGPRSTGELDPPRPGHAGVQRDLRRRDRRGAACVYKPVAGERPLWDFPDGTLADREVAAYLVSEALGWDVVPPTVLRDGPHGPGMVQLWQEPDPEQEAVDARPRRARCRRAGCASSTALDDRDQPVSLVHEDTAALRRMAVFDVVVNNADRKGGHVLAMTDGHRYGVDHGVTFHVEHKLRTVLWGWAGEPLDDDDRDRGARAAGRPARRRPGRARSASCSPRTRSTRDPAPRRAAARGSGRLPEPGEGWPAIPWPPF